MQPTEKKEAMEKTINNLTGIDRRKHIKNDECTTCGKVVDPGGFKDEASRKEFTISGMCQKCQDKIFE